MKYFYKEHKSDYSQYLFPYQVYLLKEKTDSLDDIYNLGFLPSRSKPDLFYLSRSIRIDLTKFELSSENRRIQRKTDYLTLDILSYKDFKYDYKIGKLAKDFYDARSGKGTFSVNRIKWLFTSGACSDVIVFKDGNVETGYCVANKTSSLLHYAYPFYDLDYLKKNMGMGMMLSSILWANENNLKYVYLGTCYTKSSLYKTQFKGVEFFDGEGWNGDKDVLKVRIS